MVWCLAQHLLWNATVLAAQVTLTLVRSPGRLRPEIMAPGGRQQVMTAHKGSLLRDSLKAL